MSKESLFDDLVLEVPEFAPMYDACVAEQSEYLPYMVMGSFTDFVIVLFRESQDQDHGAEHKLVIQRSLNFLETAAASPDIEVQNVVWCSFLEELHLAGSDYESIKQLLGPHLRKMLKDIERM